MTSNRTRSTRTMGTRMGAIQEGLEALEARTRTPAPTDTEERLQTVERSLELLGSANYRYEEDNLVRGADRALALLDPTYIGPGPARVIFNFETGSTLSDETYEWKGAYHAFGNRVVNMGRVGGRWYIDGHTNESLRSDFGFGYGGVIDIPLSNNWVSYNYATGTGQYTEPRAQRLPSGIVVLAGLVIDGTITSGAVIGTLPVGMRPEHNLIFPTINASSWKAIEVTWEGKILARGGWSQSFVSLDNIAFPAAGVAQWTEIGASGSGSSFANGWTGYAASVHGTPAYWKDPYGLVWFRGLLSGGTRTTDNLPMVALPATHRAHLQHHMPSVGDDGFAFVGGLPGNGLEYKTGTSGSTWISLASVKLVTAEAVAAGLWHVPRYANGWGNYSANTFTTLGLTRRPDGLGLSKGLIGNGTTTARMFTVPRQMQPALTWLMAVPSIASAGRLDMIGHRSLTGNPAVTGGQVNLNFGSNAWVGLDGMTWMVGEL